MMPSNTWMKFSMGFNSYYKSYVIHRKGFYKIKCYKIPMKFFNHKIPLVYGCPQGEQTSPLISLVMRDTAIH